METFSGLCSPLQAAERGEHLSETFALGQALAGWWRGGQAQSGRTRACRGKGPDWLLQLVLPRRQDTHVAGMLQEGAQSKDAERAEADGAAPHACSCAVAGWRSERRRSHAQAGAQLARRAAADGTDHTLDTVSSLDCCHDAPSERGRHLTVLFTAQASPRSWLPTFAAGAGSFCSAPCVLRLIQAHVCD